MTETNVPAQASDEPMRAAKPGDKCSACAGTGCEHCDHMGIEPRKIVGYADCRCILSKYCDGCCNPIWADQVATKGAKP
jgi:hypothetical protein